MQHIRIERKVRPDRARYDVLPLDPRDAEVLRAKLLLDRRSTSRKVR